MWAVLVTNNISIIREIRMSNIIEENFIPSLPKNSYFIGFGLSNGTKKFPKFLNWYDNLDYIFTWEEKEQAQSWLDKTLSEADVSYKTSKDPFFHLYKTKGDWKNYLFIVVNVNHLI
jgi:hypothetical protein